VLATGGAGFIGQAVVYELVTALDQVVVLDSLRPDVHRDGGESQRRRLSAVGADLVVGDVRDAAAVAAALHRFDAVVHLGAKVGLGLGIADMDDYVSSNDHGTAVVLLSHGQVSPGLAREKRCRMDVLSPSVRCAVRTSLPGW